MSTTRTTPTFHPEASDRVVCHNLLGPDDATATKLAKTYADVLGFEGRPGGWIYTPNGRPVAHGWSAFATKLRARRHIVCLDSGRWAIDWRTADLRPIR